MSPRRIAVGRARAVKAMLALVAASACLGAVAYAATRPGGPIVGLGGSKPAHVAPHPGAGTPQGTGKSEEWSLQPRFIESPETISSLAEPQFRFHVPPRAQRPHLRPHSLSPGQPGEATPPRRFQCRLDDAAWRGCSSPYRLGGLALGEHIFAVRAFNRVGRPGPAVDRSWRQVEASKAGEVDPRPFSIELRGELEHLHPGFPAQPLPVLVTNPNSVPIEVTSITVGIAADAPSCSSENFVLTPSSVTPAAPLTVAAGGSVGLPTASASAPSIGMLNLPVDQDPCQGAEVPLVFSGEAHG